MAQRRVLIIGGGTGGISVAARLVRELGKDQVAVIEPSENHYYQPLWTLVGGGAADVATTCRKEKDVMPSGVEWIREKVRVIDPVKKQVQLENGDSLGYEFLVVASGLRLCWEKIKGLEGHLGTKNIVSIYEFDQAPKAASAFEAFQGGRALFIMPPVPIKCAGAPQKIMYLADEIFRRNGVRAKSEVVFATAGKAMFGVPTFSKVMEGVVARKDIKVWYQHKLLEIVPDRKIAKFQVTSESGVTEVEQSYDLIHVVPPMAAHNFIQESGLAFTSGDQTGWLKVDKFTLQHLDFPNIFGIGDVTGVPNSKTGAAIRKQAPVVVANLLQVMKTQKPTVQYDGYASCPLVTGFGKVVLAEFGYDGKLMPTFPLDPTVERRSMWHLKKDLLPILYWHGMLKGRA